MVNMLFWHWLGKIRFSGYVVAPQLCSIHSYPHLSWYSVPEVIVILNSFVSLNYNLGK